MSENKVALVAGALLEHVKIVAIRVGEPDSPQRFEADFVDMATGDRFTEQSLDPERLKLWRTMAGLS